MTVAALGLTADSRSLQAAIPVLREVAKAAGEAEKAADGLAGKSAKAGKEVASEGKAAERAASQNKKLGDKVTDTGAGMRRLAAIAGSLAGKLAAAFTVRAIINYADAWSDMQSKVGSAIKDMSAAPELMGRMVDLANASYSPLGQTVDLFSRNVSVMRTMGYTAGQAADFTEALNHALVTTATKGDDANVVINSLSRALSAGKLDADAYDVIMSRSPRVMQAIADKAGVAVTSLRAMASQGKVTGAMITAGMLTSLEKLRGEAGEMPATVADGMQRIGTGLQYLIGVLDQTTGASGSLAGVLVMVGDALANAAKWASENGDTIQFVFDSVIGTAIAGATALAARFAVTWVASMYASATATGAFSAAMVTLRGALIATGIGAVVVAAGVLIGQFLKLVQLAGGVGEAMRLIGEVATEAWGRVSLKFDAMSARMNAGWLDIKASTADAMATAIEWVAMLPEKAVAAFDWAVNSIATLFRNLPRLIGSGILQAINFVLEKVEGLIQKAIDGVNKLIAGLNKIPGVDIAEIGRATIGRVSGAVGGAIESISEFSLGDVAAGLRGEAGGMRGQADAYREAGRMLESAASRPMTAWEKLKSLFAQTNDIVKETTTDTKSLGDALAEKGKKGKNALADILKGLRQEYELLKATAGMSDLQAAIWEKQREAKVKATSAAGKEIETLMTAIDRMKDLKSATEDFRGTMAQAFTGLVTGAHSLRDAVGNIIGKLAEMAAMRGFDLLWSGGLGKASGGFLGALLGFANGAAFQGGRVTAFANGGVVSGPTNFPMRGGVGLMGEAGPEAIMPLKRGADGKLGVTMSRGSGGGGKLSIGIGFDASIDAFRATVRDETGQIVAEGIQQATPSIVSRSVSATGSAMKKTKSFGNGGI